MKILTTVILSFLCISAHADEWHKRDDLQKTESELWQKLYEAQDWQYCHNKIMGRKRETLNDEVLGLFMMSFYCYKVGATHEIEEIYGLINWMIKENYVNQEY